MGRKARVQLRASWFALKQEIVYSRKKISVLPKTSLDIESIVKGRDVNAMFASTMSQSQKCAENRIEATAKWVSSMLFEKKNLRDDAMTRMLVIPPELRLPILWRKYASPPG